MIEDSDDYMFPARANSRKTIGAGGERLPARPEQKDDTNTRQGNAKTVYSDLPANASKFTFSQQLIVNNGGVPIVTDQYEVFSKTVPEGYVLYVKEFRVNIQNATSTLDPFLSGIPDVNSLVSLSNNNNVSPFNDSLIVEPLSGFYPCYFIAGQNAIVKLRLKVDFTAMPSQPTDLQIISFIRGDVLARNSMQPIYTALEERKK